MSSRIGRRLAVVIALLPAGVVGVGTQSGLAAPPALRYAAPHGSPTATCAKSDPCAITTAFDNLTEDAEIVVLPGTYGSAADPLPLLGNLSSATVYAHGTDSRHMPTLYLGADAVGIELSGLSTLQYLTLISSASNSAMIIEGTVDHVVSISSSPGGACEAYSDDANTSVPLDDSLCVATAPNAAAIDINAGEPNSVGINGDTAISTGAGGIGVLVEESDAAASNHVSIVDSIVRGTAAGVQTLDAPGAGDTVRMSHSDYSLPLQAASDAPITTDSTDISTAPKFVHSAAGNFHEAAGSPTINRGSAGGGFDLDGNPRTVAGRPDMGAYEYSPPPTGVHVKITQRGSLSLHVTLTFNNHDADSLVHLVFSHGTQHHSTNARHVAASTKVKSLQIVLSGLRPNRRYAVAGVVVGLGGTAKSAVIHGMTKKKHPHKH